jgi:hypothetical protein
MSEWRGFEAMREAGRMAARQLRWPRRETETFTFCVGRPWPDELCIGGNPGGTAIRTYAHGTQVKHGTMADAEAFRQYVNARTGEENFIYKLVKVA